MKVQWVSPEEKKRLAQEKENLGSQLKTERRRKQELVNLLEDLRSQQLKETIQTKLETLRGKREELKFEVGKKLGDGQRFLLDSLLDKQEGFDLEIFDKNVDRTSRAFLRAQDKLQEIKDKLLAKLNSEEIEELCKIQTEISKLESSQSQ